MALFYQHNINHHTRLAVWRIEEPESFFLEKVPLKKEVTHPYKRLQHLAGRFLLPYLYPDFPLEEILIADTLKPFLPDEKYHFSISHSGNFAAAIVSPDQRVGIDIELVSPRIEKIASKFLSLEEQEFLHQWELFQTLQLELTTVLWSAKEAMFKWYGDGQVDFRRHLQFSGPLHFAANEWMSLPFQFQKNTPLPVTIQARIFNPLVLACLAT